MRIFIDPPVSEYSTPEEIKEWIQELQEMDKSEEREEALSEAYWMLNLAEKGSQTP